MNKKTDFFHTLTGKNLSLIYTIKWKGLEAKRFLSFRNCIQVPVTEDLIIVA